MFDTIIFSNNNPQRLSLTLQSLKNFPKESVFYIFYTCQDIYNEGYEWLKKKNSSLNIEWVPYKNFKEELVETLKTKIKSNEILFLTDIDVVFKEFDYNIIKNCLSQEDVLCHSLKLGKNITFCARMGVDNVIKTEDFDTHIKWDWTKHYLDFGYPFSLNSHVFNLKDITKLIQKTNFRNHIELEDGLQMFEHYPKQFMTAFRESRSVVVPNNPDYITYEEFNKGYIPDFDSMNFSNLNKCEEEIYFENIKTAK